MRPTPDGAPVLDAAWSEREVVRQEDGTHEVRQSTVDGLLREASAVLEGNPAPTPESQGVGPEPVPGDGEPVVGALAEVFGHHVASTHSGATLALVVGELLADEVLTGEPSPLLAAFRPSRSCGGRRTARVRCVTPATGLPPRPRGASGGAVGLGGDDGLLAAGERPRGPAVGAARPPVAVGGLLDEVALRVGRAVARAFERVGHVNTTFLKRTPADALPRWTTGTGRWVASATVRVSPRWSARVKTRPEPVTVIRSGR